MRTKLLAMVLAAFWMLPHGAAAQESIAIRSFTPAAPAQALKLTGPAVTLSGNLYLPKGAGPFPAVVLKHGSGGMEGVYGANVRDWAATMAGWGVAALIVDSFAPRGITSTATNQASIAPWAEVADSFAALKALAADKRIDKTRIGIMGWSRGGISSMNTALETGRKAMAGDLKFAAHIILYGPAMTQFRDTATDKAPFLFIHGDADNYVPIAPAREYSEWLKRMGNAVTFAALPGGLHNFDVTGAAPTFVGTVEVSAKCDNIINLADNKILRMDHKDNPALKPGEFEAYQKACVSKGANLGFDAKLRAEAVEKVRVFLKETLRAPG